MSNNLLENLNPEQLKAVTHKDGPLLIVAGAGSGKTTVIAQRVAYIIEQGWAGAEEILALTFTDKAAGEMEERVERLLPIGYLDLWISTFHSFAERILKQHGLDIGLSADFKLLNEFQQWVLIRKNLAKFNLDYYRPLGNPTKFIQALVRHFSRAKDEDIGPAEYLAYAEGLKENLDGMMSGGFKNKKSKIQSASRRTKQITNHKSQITNLVGAAASNDMAEQEVKRVSEIANGYHVYQQLLLDNKALDFGDLINYCLKLFRQRPAILEHYRQKFKFILLDEFQDTNWSQYELVKLLAAPKNNLVVVGDDDQSIFRFRGASMSNILQFRQDFPEAKQIILIKNYRNRQNILDLAYNFIKLNNPNRLEYKINQERRHGAGAGSRLDKKLIAQQPGLGEIKVLSEASLSEEIGRVIETIADLKIKDRESSWNDFAILLRANESAKEFCRALDLAGLPFQFLSSRGLFAQPVIMDILAYLKLLDNYHESVALYRVLNIPVFNFSYQELVNFNYWAGRKSWSLYEVLKNLAGLKFGAEAQVKADKVLNLIAKHSALARQRSAREIIMAFLEDSGYLKYLMSQNELNSRQAANNLNVFMKKVQAFEAVNDDQSVKNLLAELTLEIEAGEQGELPQDLEAGPELIKVMTVHSAKGLEFKYVFIAGLVDKRFPTIERGEAISLPDSLIKEILPVGDIHLEEERRLFYVAMTRAKQGLYLSWARDYGGSRQKKPSRFLVESGLLGEAGEAAGAARGREGKISKDLVRQSWLKPAAPEAGQQRQPSITAPNYFSYTQLAAFSSCPYQYRFAHVLKLPVKGKAAFSFGKTLHATLQKLFGLIMEKRGLGQGNLFSPPQQHPADRPADSAMVSWEEILAIYEQCWVDDWYESKSGQEERKASGRQILKDFYHKYCDHWPEVLYLEKDFKIRLAAGRKTYSLRGRIDRVDKINGQIKIIDYKSGRAKAKLTFEEKEQLLIYQLAAVELFAQPLKSLAFYYLDNNSELEFLGSQEDLAKVKEKVIKTIREIHRGEFPAKPSQLCKYCDFFSICEFRQS